VPRDMDKQKAAKKRWRVANHDKVRVQIATWRTNNSEKRAAQNSRRLEKLRRRSLEWRQQHPGYAQRLNIKSVYGISVEDRDRLFDLQGRCCAACGSPDPRFSRGWHIDHDHSKKKGDSGFIRGVLCFPCNQAANRHHTPASLRALADYIEKRQ